jgi:hypothetical protein
MNYQFEFSDEFMLPTLGGACDWLTSEDQSSQGDVTVGTRKLAVGPDTSQHDTSLECLGAMLARNVFQRASASSATGRAAGCKRRRQVANAGVSTDTLLRYRSQVTAQGPSNLGQNRAAGRLWPQVSSTFGEGVDELWTRCDYQL